MLLKRVVLPPVLEQPPLRDKLLGFREQALVGVLNHGRHTDRRPSRDHPLDPAILAPVDQVLVACNPGRPVADARHHPQGLVDHGPEVRPLLEVGPLEIEGVGALQGVLEAGEGCGLGEEVECYAREG